MGSNQRVPCVQFQKKEMLETSMISSHNHIGLLLGVDIKTDDALAVLLSGFNVHIHLREGCRDERGSGDVNRNVNLASLQWEFHGLHCDLTRTSRQLADNVSGGITGARGNFDTQGLDLRSELGRSHILIRNTGANESGGSSSGDAAWLQVIHMGMGGSAVLPGDCKSAGLDCNLLLLLGVDVKADDALAVLLRGFNVHIHLREGCRDERGSCHVNRNVDLASLQWEVHG